MGVRLTALENRVALFDSTSGFAFGPTFTSIDEAEEFLLFVGRETEGKDARSLSDRELEDLEARFQEECDK